MFTKQTAFFAAADFLFCVSHDLTYHAGNTLHYDF